MKISKYLLIIPVFSFFIFALSAEASILYLLPESRDLVVGQEFYVDVKVNTEDIFINAVQTTINFPNDILEVLDADKHNSVFNFWIDEPILSNEEGVVSFIGGTAKGVSGDSLQVLRIKFKASGSGLADLGMIESVITANDGKGTNVLSAIEGANVSVGVAEIIPAPVFPSTIVDIPKEQVFALPQKVERTTIVATSLPDKPTIEIPLYPDETKWYDHQAETIVLWEVPGDVAKVAVAVDKNPNTEPPEAEEELFSGKNIGVLDEGINYVHVQFKNSRGWGEVSHYRIAIDATTPLPFEIKIDNEAGDNPSPKIQYGTNDSLSGINEYIVYVNGRELLRTDSIISTLPIQAPGKHTLSVRAIDKAGNSVEDDLEFEILPLPTPVVGFLTEKVVQEEIIFASGNSIPGGFIDFQILDKNNQEVSGRSVDVNNVGDWEILVEETLAKGKYHIIFTARDDRGAVSYPTEPRKINISAKTILLIGFVDLGWFEILLIIVSLIIAGAGVGAWYYVTMQKKREAYTIIAGRDIVKLSTLLENNVKELEKLAKGPEIKLHLTKMKTTIAKMKKYLTKTIKKINS